MFWGTHAAIPVLTAVTIDLIRVNGNKERLVTNKQLIFIGLAGILPDMLWPHFSLHARHTSYTHTVWFLLLLLPVLILIARKTVPNHWKWFSAFFFLGCLAHTLVDSLSGGVSFLYPIEGVYGGRYIPWDLWIYSDIAMIIITRAVYYFMNKNSLKSNLTPEAEKKHTFIP